MLPNQSMSWYDIDVLICEDLAESATSIRTVFKRSNKELNERSRPAPGSDSWRVRPAYAWKIVLGARERYKCHSLLQDQRHSLFLKDFATLWKDFRRPPGLSKGERAREETVVAATAAATANSNSNSNNNNNNNNNAAAASSSRQHTTTNNNNNNNNNNNKKTSTTLGGGPFWVPLPPVTYFDSSTPGFLFYRWGGPSRSLSKYVGAPWVALSR